MLPEGFWFVKRLAKHSIYKSDVGLYRPFSLVDFASSTTNIVDSGKWVTILLLILIDLRNLQSTRTKQLDLDHIIVI